MQIGKQGTQTNSLDTTRLGKPAHMTVDAAANEVYVADGYCNHRVIVFDAETGAFKRQWGAYGKPPTDDKMPAYDPSAAAVAAVRQSGALRAASRATGWSTFATGPTIACRCSARTERS